MAPRQIKMPGKDNSDTEAEEVFSQRKRPESGRYLLQIDKQTKGSYKTPRRLSHVRFAPQKPTSAASFKINSV